MVGILQEEGIAFDSFDILSDNEVCVFLHASVSMID